MTTDRIGAIEALLVEAEAAHGVYETTELQGVYDQQWPRWYAAYAVDHGVGDLVGRAIGADELSGVLDGTWDSFQQADPKPTEPWARWAARVIVKDL